MKALQQHMNHARKRLAQMRGREPPSQEELDLAMRRRVRSVEGINQPIGRGVNIPAPAL